MVKSVGFIDPSLSLEFQYQQCIFCMFVCICAMFAISLCVNLYALFYACILIHKIEYSVDPSIILPTREMKK